MEAESVGRRDDGRGIPAENIGEVFNAVAFRLSFLWRTLLRHEASRNKILNGNCAIVRFDDRLAHG